MEHGGDLVSYEGFYDGELIDFSSNINPMGVPQGLKEALVAELNDVENYPDIKYRKLKASVSNYLKCNIENTIVGNGAVELIDYFTILANRVIVCTPSFSEYKKRAIVHNKEVIEIPYREDFTVDLLALGEKIEEGDLLILGNPNNPTGLRVDKIEILMLYNLTMKAGAYLLLDEAFFEFCSMDYDSIELFRQSKYENLGIIRAATKFFALPGARLGYGCTSTSLVDRISKIEMPWSVNSFAETLGNYIFKDKEYIEESKRYIEIERDHLLKELSKISYIKVFPTETNYILIRLLRWNEEYIFNFFLRRGIVIRKASSFTGLDESYIRVAIKTREKNNKLIDVFKELENIK